jgi:L-threonylcarbamoyladenylate synthase
MTNMTVVPNTGAGIELAVQTLRAGQAVIYPAETMYGIGVDPFRPDVVETLFAAKQRPVTNPIPLIIADTDQLTTVVREVSNRAQRLIDHFWPGPLSLVFPKAENVPSIVTAHLDNVCVRCPASDTARAIARAFDSAITSTSANRSGEAPATSLQFVDESLARVFVDAGTLSGGPPSTIFDVAADTVVRQGAVPEDAIRRCLDS